MSRAVKAVLDQKWTIIRASQAFGVPETTLKRRLPLMRKSSRMSILTEEEEDMIVRMVIEKSSVGQPLSRQDLFKEVKKILDEKQIITHFHDNLPSYGWLIYFLKRHPELPKESLKQKFAQ